MSAEFIPKQVYKNRAEAFRLFVAAQNLPVSQAKFYQDADRLGLTKPDKTVDLASLTSYVRNELKVSPSTGQSLVDRSNIEDLSDYELRKARAEALIKEMQAEEAQRKLDDKWLHSDTAWAAVAALVGTLRDALRHQFHVGVPQLIHLAGGDPLRGPEVYEGAEEILNRAFNGVVAAGRIEALFSEEAQQDEDPI